MLSSIESLDNKQLYPKIYVKENHHFEISKKYDIFEFLDKLQDLLDKDYTHIKIVSGTIKTLKAEILLYRLETDEEYNIRIDKERKVLKEIQKISEERPVKNLQDLEREAATLGYKLVKENLNE